MLAELNTMVTDTLGPLGPLFIVGAFGVLLIAVTLPVFLKKRAEPFDKLRANGGTAVAGVGGRQLRIGEKTDKLEKYAEFLEPKDAKSMSAARLRMLRAGYRNKNAVRTFHFAQFSLGLGMLFLGFLYTLYASIQGEVSTQTMLISTAGPGGLGYYFPQYWITKRIQTRQQEIISGFPDSLDLMLVCVEAGQSLDQSINRVARETRVGYPALADEFDLVAQEVKAGKERVAVLKDMAERVGVPDVASFVTTLVQSASFGTSIAEALRVYSAEMRDKRVMRAEEKANVLPTKLTLGTMLFTLPPLLVILMGPAMHNITQTLSKY